MSFAKIRSLSLAIVIGLGVIFLSLNLFGMTSAVLAQPHLNLNALVVFPDPTAQEVLDLSGNVVGQGVHTGEVRCREVSDNCNKNTRLDLTSPGGPYSVEYQFKSLQVLDPEAKRLVVAGRGTIFRGLQKGRFLFTATFEDKRDGTLWARYEASRPDASFIVPSSPGELTFISSP